MKVFLKHLSDYTKSNHYLAFSIAYIVIGLLIIIFNHHLLSSIVEILLFIMLLLCVKDLIHLIWKEEKSRFNFLRTIINTILVFVALLNPSFPSAMIIMIFAIYLFFNGIVKLFSFYLQKKDKISGGGEVLFEGLVLFFYGIICFFSPKIHMDTMLYIVGTYVVLMGISYLFDFLDSKNIRLRHVRFPLPAIIDALIPFSILQKINTFTNEEAVLDFNKKGDHAELEIFVHVSPKGNGKLGHVDFCFEGMMMSYGNYDMRSRRMGEGIGSGVVFQAKRNPYIHFCTEYGEKTLFVFGIKLNTFQKEKVKKELEKIQDNLVEWKPYYVRALAEKQKMKKGEYTDYVSMLYKKTKAKFYKFKTGKMKTFFILGTNCGTLVDKILRSSGAEVLKMYGVITPGTYYDFLEREYRKKDSNVIYKKIYHKGNLEQLEKK